MSSTAYLFDYGGTLDTAARHWFYVLHEGFREAGLSLADADFRPAYVFAERALARHPYIRPTDDFLDMLRKKTMLEVEYLRQHTSLLPDSLAATGELADRVALYCDNYARRHVQASAHVLAQLAESHPLIVVSNFYGNLPTILRTYGIDRYFQAVIESATVGVRKPNPEIFRLGVAASGCSAEQCIVVGDSYTKDILPAHELGCQTIWFKGKEWEEVERDESIPNRVITSLEEILEG